MTRFFPISDQILEIRDIERSLDYWIELAVFLEDRIPSLEEALNTEDSVVLIYKEACDIQSEEVLRLIHDFDGYNQKNKHTHRSVQIPVKYAKKGTDLELVSARLGLSVDEVIDLHTQGEYQLVMYGFVPGFAYLRGLPDILQMPRKDTPSLDIKAGAVSIAENYSGIYPFDGQGGWYVLGYTDFRFVDGDVREPHCLPGDVIEFVKV